MWVGSSVQHPPARLVGLEHATQPIRLAAVIIATTPIRITNPQENTLR
jgi:hypothetical protein